MTTTSNSRILRIIPLLIIIILFCPFAYGKIIYVADDGLADFDNIQAGINAAIDGDTVLVAPGTYTGTGNRDINFRGKAITVRSTDPNDPAIIASTIIDCQGQGRGFTFESGEQADSILKGVTITNGKAMEGGGISISNSSPTISNCTIKNNMTFTIPSGDGGGIFIWDGSPIIANCTISGNTTGGRGDGGGIYIHGDIQGSKPTISQCSIIENIGGRGGGIYILMSSPYINHCTIADNYAVGGGGLYLGGMGWSDEYIIRVENCRITGNFANSLSGGVYTILCTLDMSNCIISGNRLLYGGAGGGFSITGLTIAQINQCTIVGNKVIQYTPGVNCVGGGLYLQRCDAKITNSIIRQNQATKGAQLAINAWDGQQWADKPPMNDPTLVTLHQNDFNSEQDQEFYIYGEPNLLTLEMHDNLDTDPCFADAGFWDPNGTPDDPNDDFWVDGDYHLKSQAGRFDPNNQSWIFDDVTSPCIDAGDPNSSIGSEPFPNGGIINMGAYGGTSEASKSSSGSHTKYGGGTGEPNDPYLIYTAEQMNQIGLHEEDWDKHFMLMADIDLSAYTGASFNLIGGYDSDWNEKSFSGVFKGNGHVISGFTYHGDSLANAFFVGLFRSVDGVNARIQDLRLIDPNVGGGRYIGALVGQLHNGTISNCVIEAGRAIDPEGTDIGGIVGINIQGIMSNCRAEHCVVQGRSRVGGLTGTNEGTVQNCYSSGEISGKRMIGGQAGGNFGSIINSYSTCRVTGLGSMQLAIGGLTGLNRGTIQTCYAKGDVTGIDDVGGLVGQNGDNSNITDSYATGHVSGIKNIGGLVGTCIQNNSIDKCYSTGSVSAEENGGGLVGQHEGTLSECYSTAFVIVEADNAGGLVGDNRGTIRMSCAHGHVSGKNYIGGLVGNNLTSVVTDSYAGGSVHGEDVVGGLIGFLRGSTVSRCYTTAKVRGATVDTRTGGLVSVNAGDISIENSFWDTEASGQTTSAGGTGRTTALMQAASTFLNADWDLMDETTNGSEDVWWIFEGRDYPRLWWQYGRAFFPYPQDGATDVIQPLLLNWAPGGPALSHDVYFGEDAEAVADATTENPVIYHGRQASEITSYDPGKLKLAETYYWRIDEVNEADPNNSSKGWVWSFTTADFIIVDDFESYKDHDNEVWYSWHDGLGCGAPGSEPYFPGNGTGSAVGDETWSSGSHMETLIVHGGRQSMPYSYDNNKPGFLKYSEATLSLDYPRNWTEGGAEVLSLWFYGDLANFPAPMYVAVADANGPTEEVVYHENPYAALTGTWTEWTIDLQDFADQGVNLTDINSISIGFGDRNNPQPGGSGRMFFDDIRLYRLLP